MKKKKRNEKMVKDKPMKNFFQSFCLLLEVLKVFPSEVEFVNVVTSFDELYLIKIYSNELESGIK